MSYIYKEQQGVISKKKKMHEKHNCTIYVKILKQSWKNPLPLYTFFTIFYYVYLDTHIYKQMHGRWVERTHFKYTRVGVCGGGEKGVEMGHEGKNR